MNCLLTGATGIVGSHILFEWLHTSLTSGKVNHLYVVIRSNTLSSRERLLQILDDKNKPSNLQKYNTAEFLKKITVIDSDLKTLQLHHFKNLQIDSIIHCAGSTNLLHTNDTENYVNEQNFEVTKHLLQTFKRHINRFIYISTAYSFGIQKHKVDDFIDNHKVDTFRNPYEASKYYSESYVKKYCKAEGISSQILRPSIVCGRLIEPPYFETPKFDVFYSWPMFLNKYAQHFKDNFRIWIDQKSGLNIVPVDFVAKTIIHAVLHPEITELNIVNPQQILHKDYVGHVLKAFRIHNFEFTNKKPEHLNAFETLYYKSIGVLFEKYVSIPDLQFNAEGILKVIDKLDLNINLDVHNNFMKLVDFSVEKKFRKSYI